MAHLYERMSAAVLAAMRVWADPQKESGLNLTDRSPYYDRMWGYYSNEAFGDLPLWHAYKDKNWLYAEQRSIYNPTRRLVEFYVGEVYPGVLSVDGRELPEGVPSAIPFTEDTPENVKKAASQFYRWGNWQKGKDLMVRYAEALGNTLVELVSDLKRKKVVPRVWWPSHVRDLVLDETDNVKSYTIQYTVNRYDDTGKSVGTYQYKKVVTSKDISTFMDDAPYDYVNDQPAGPLSVQTNDYGFAPAVWQKAVDTGEDFGQPRMWATLGKIDELNSLASMAHDQIGKIFKSPVVLITDQGTQVLTPGTPEHTKAALEASKRATEGAGGQKLDRDKAKVIKLKPGSDIKALPFDMAQALEYMAALLAEIEHDHPELAMYSSLRSMGNISGIAAARLMGDVAGLVYSAQASYDLQTVKMTQMAISMVAFHIKNGDFGSPASLPSSYDPFKGFDLDSFANGKLNMDIAPRPIIDSTELERHLTEQAKWNTLALKKDVGEVPIEQILEEGGYTPQQIKTFLESKQVAQEELGVQLMRAFNSGQGANPTNVGTGGASQEVPQGSNADGSTPTTQPPAVTPAGATQ